MENDLILGGRPISAGKSIILSDELLQIAHRYILFNSSEVQPYVELHLQELRSSDRRLSRNHNQLQKRHIDTFIAWFSDKVIIDEIKCNASCVSNTLKWFANGPRDLVMSFNGYIINGLRFHTKETEKSRQNSGVLVEATTLCRSSARDNTQILGQVAYYGVLKDILLLNYHIFQVPLFKCDWANIVNGVKVDDGFVLVNLHEGQSQFEKDPFILASQAKQVFYCRENETSNWYVVGKAPPRGYHELQTYDENYMPSIPRNLGGLETIIDNGNEDLNLRIDSSKNAAKRALKQRQAIYTSIIRSRNRGIVITNEDSSSRSVNPNTQDTPNTQVTQESNCETKKKTRGVTRMVKLKFNQPVEVDFNLHGQTIDGSSITLASYIGILAREHIPITLESWKKVDEQKKDMIWSSLLQYFKLLDSSKDYIFKKMGGRWRQYKSRITKKLIEASQGPGKKRALKLLKPKNVTNAGNWNEFKNEAKEKGKDPEKITRVDVWIEGHKRKKNKPLSEAVQTTMDEINQLRESTCPPNDNSINEDSLVKVLGAEKRGRVKGLGFRATSSRVQTQIQSGGRIKQLEAELKATNDQVASLKDMIMKQNDQLLNRGVQMEDAVGSHVYTPPHVFMPQSQHGSVPMTQDMSKFENARCHLLHWYPEDDSEDQIVAEGRISSTNSKDKIHNMPLGKGYWRVWIDAVSIDIKVCQSTNEYEMLSQAVGSSVAWLKDCIKIL
ncbi:hypothetical protein ACOSQ2_032075 [Xanthoceras sorbifolium]